MPYVKWVTKRRQILLIVSRSGCLKRQPTHQRPRRGQGGARY